MLRYDAVLFDVDGTLLHTRPGIEASFAHAFRQMGLDPAGIDLGAYLGPPLRWSFGRHFADPADVERAVEAYRAHYAAVGSHLCRPYPGVASLLACLREAGVFLATATSKPVEVVTPILREQGLAEAFDLIGGASMDASVDTKTAVIRAVLADERLAGKRVLMVGDRQDDMRGAADCGRAAAAGLYGYGSRAELAPWKPVFFAESPEQLGRSILQ